VAGMSDYFTQEPEELEDDDGEAEADAMEEQLKGVINNWLPGNGYLAAVSQEKSFGSWKVWVTSQEYFAKKHCLDDRCAPKHILKFMKEIAFHHACDMVFTTSHVIPVDRTREEVLQLLETNGFILDKEFQQYADTHGC
jgi:hypothetical protein